MGRPSLIHDQHIVDRVIQAIEAGNVIEHAASYAGIAPACFYKWQRRGRDAQALAEEREQPISEDDQPYVKLVERVEKARHAAIVRNVALIQRAANEGNWQAAAWYLERRYPEHFARREHHKHDHGGKVQVVTTPGTDERRAEIARILNGASATDSS